MKYHDGQEVCLGDRVTVPVPSGSAKARIVMLGDTYEHLDVDPDTLDWINRDKVLKPDAVLIEWIDSNPFSHDDPKFAPVANQMFTVLDEFVTRDN
ncbi:MAG: hypothetical protein JWN73_2486 [Betaproteobacteria bacterium]|nr:hypothetical protein [Betaproteobacteria bacterium]